MNLPPLEYLLNCSMKSLQELELAALDRSAQCVKAARSEMEEAVAQREVAGVARWLTDHRPFLLEEARRTIEAERGQPILAFPETNRELPSFSYSKPSDGDLCTVDIVASRAMRRCSSK